MSVRYVTPPRPDRVNYDESAVPPYVLPDPLAKTDGSRIATADEWTRMRRGELLELFAREVYGQAPDAVTIAVVEAGRDERSLGGLATRLELDVEVSFRVASASGSFVLSLLLWLPNARPRAPVFLGLNLAGNQTVHPDPGIRLARGWAPHLPELGLVDHVATDSSRGMHAKRWPVEMIISRGYALATAYAGDIEPDFPEGAATSPLRSGFGDSLDRPGSIAAWAFGLSRALDALERTERIDSERVAVIGHSRLGKAALWAGARDPRFALVIANSSGRGGAALSRRRFGETVADLNRRFPHWFCPRFRAYDEREAELPVDQHELLALIAPRPIALGNAELDGWCDPRGERLAAAAAHPVFELFGLRSLDASALSETASGTASGEQVHYHLRPGGHDLLASDWWHYLAAADRFLGSRAA